VTSGSTVNYVYDAAGNVTNDGVHTYQYDSENRIVSVDGGSTASYAYDHQNRRYKKTIGSTVTHYVWQGSQVLAEHNGSTGAVLIDYVYSGGRMIAKVESASTKYFLSDRLSVRLSLDTSGNVIGRQGHLPFGEDFAESGTQEKHHFTSYERDGESGTDYAVNRQYSATIGRFNRPDPADASVRSNRPQTWNRYTYVNNMVPDRVDPTGLFPVGEGPPPDPCTGMSAGECLCRTVPEACYGKHPPLEDGGNGGSGGETEPFVAYRRVTWEKTTVDFIPGLAQAQLNLSGDACEGKIFEIRVFFRVIDASFHSIPESEFIGDSDFKFLRRAGEDASNGEEIEIIRLQRVKRGSGKGSLSIRIEGEKNGMAWGTNAIVRLRCSRTQ
jgi:RHS repeat-associated protein